MIEKQPTVSARITSPVIFVVTFLGFLDTHLLIPVMALYASALGADIGTVGLIIGLYSMTNTPANILFGKLVDRVGYKAPLTIGLASDALSMFLYSLCRAPVQLALVRAFHGIGGALVGPATMAVAAEHAVRNRKGRAMGFYGMSLAAASLVGYPLSGVIASRLGYSAIFLSGAVIIFIGLVLSLLLPGSSKSDRTITGVPIVETLKHIKSLLTREGLSFPYFSIFAQCFSFGAVVTLLPFHLANLGMGAFQVGILLATFSVMFMVFQLPAGMVSDKVGRLPPAVCGLGIGIVSLVLLPALAFFPLLLVAMALYGMGYGLLFPSISAMIVDHTQYQERGTATGVFHALLTTGVAIGAPVMGWVGAKLGVSLGLMLAPTVMLLTLVAVLVKSRLFRITGKVNRSSF